MALESYVFIPESTMLGMAFRSIKPHARLLYAYMVLKRAGKDERFSYSYKEIRKDAGFKFETIANSIRQLAAAGLIEYKHGGLELNHNTYYLDPVFLTRGKPTS